MSVPLKVSLPIALEALGYIRNGSSLEKAMRKAILDEGPDIQAAVQSILYSATRHAFLAKALIKELVSREPTPIVFDLLVIVLAQLLETPQKAYAIVNETIGMMKSYRQLVAAGGFVNACLRRFGREKEALLTKVRDNPEVKYNAPAWYIHKLEVDIGEEKAHAALLLAQKKPPLTLRINRRKTSLSDWCALARKHKLESIPLGKDAVILSTPIPVGQIPGFYEGLVSVQDAGAQLAAEFLNPPDNGQVLDACAAPGGKTAHLLELYNVTLTACEIDPIRAKKIEENLKRLDLKSEIIVCDASEIDTWGPSRRFDAILLDAPCTASGIFRRHPDIVFNRRPEDIQTLALQQKKLLETLWPHLKFGGKLLYVVCSLFKEEGVSQITNFVKRHRDALLTPLADTLPAMLTLIPCESSDMKSAPLPNTHDGFFYALLTKRS